MDNPDDSEEIVETPQIPEWNINLGTDTSIPFFPDGNSNYFTYSFRRAVDDNFIIQLDGIFPKARYFSVVLYDINSRDPIAIINDTEFMTSEENTNPFVSGVFSNNQNYRLAIGPNTVDLSNFDNSLSYDTSLTDISIFIRYYEPSIDNLGGVSLPDISIQDINQNEVEAPISLDLSEVLLVGDIAADLTFLGSILFNIESNATNRQFFRVSAESTGNFANPDNQYLISPNVLGDNEVILLRWQAPLAAENFSNFEESDMRYFSMSLSNEASYNFKTISDSQLYVASDGFINLVIAREDAEIAEQAVGLNLLEWPQALENEGYLLYRNLLTNENYDFNLDLCPALSGNFLDFINDTDSFEAAQYLSNYAPQGLKMTKEAFLENFGGISVSY